MSEYKRLTERSGNGIAIKETSTNDNLSIWNSIERLAELEDKIENKILIELPFNIGSKCYVLNNYYGGFYNIYECVFTDIMICKKNTFISLLGDGHVFAENITQIGKTIFLSKEDATAKFRELKEI